MKIIFFAELREKLGCETVDLSAGNLSVLEVRQRLIEHQPKWESALMHGDVLVSINQTMAKLTDCVQSDDELAFFPPVTGG